MRSTREFPAVMFPTQINGNSGATFGCHTQGVSILNISKVLAGRRTLSGGYQMATRNSFASSIFPAAFLMSPLQWKSATKCGGAAGLT